MMKMHCDVCDDVIDGDYYTFTRHDESNFETHKDVCIKCWNDFTTVKKGVKSGLLTIVYTQELKALQEMAEKTEEST